MTKPAYVGISVSCTLCGRTKQPRGRSAPMESNYCDFECEGYELDPKPGCLWPRETDVDFGYKSCAHATRRMTDEEVKKWEDEQC